MVLFLDEKQVNTLLELVDNVLLECESFPYRYDGLDTNVLMTTWDELRKQKDIFEAARKGKK